MQASLQEARGLGNPDMSWTKYNAIDCSYCDIELPFYSLIIDIPGQGPDIFPLASISISAQKASFPSRKYDKG